jgi:hypothetical protein
MRTKQHKYRGVWSLKNKRPGFVYVFALGFDGLYKVGCAKNWQRRLHNLRASNPMLRHVAHFRVGHMKRDEDAAHIFLVKYWVERELFRLDTIAIDKLVEYMKDRSISQRDENHDATKTRSLKMEACHRKEIY